MSTVKGRLTIIQVGGQAVTTTVNQVRLSQDKALDEVYVMGQEEPLVDSVSKTRGFTCSGPVRSALYQTLQSAYDSGESSEFSLQVGEAGQATDIGVWTGDVEVSNLTIEAQANGRYNWNLSATFNGPATHTPPAEDEGSE